MVLCTCSEICFTCLFCECIILGRTALQGWTRTWTRVLLKFLTYTIDKRAISFAGNAGKHPFCQPDNLTIIPDTKNIGDHGFRWLLLCSVETYIQNVDL